MKALINLHEQLHFPLLSLIVLLNEFNIATSISINCDPNQQYSIAILSDIHIGDAAGEEVILLAQDAVNQINSMSKENDICLVFITGDLTNSAMGWQYEKVKEILDGLEVPYIPSIGNHDMWSYNSTWEELNPTGDRLFAETFKENLALTDTYNNRTVWNTEENIYSWFQNWALTFGNIKFISLDWNSREEAVWELDYKGSMPGAQLHDFEGGTFQWLSQILENEILSNSSVELIIFLQHHPYRTPWWVPGFIYSFSDDQIEMIQNLITKYFPVEKYWGVIAGHIHEWFNGTAFDGAEWSTFRQWETDACKLTGAFSLLTIKENKVIDLQRFYY